MPVVLTFRCDGCMAEERGTRSLQKRFVSVSGRSYGIGSYQYVNTPAELAPEGWVAFDPYTQCCYCPDCWASIETDKGEA